MFCANTLSITVEPIVIAVFGASASPPRGLGEAALLHHCGRSQPVIGAAAFASKETYPV
jgi:hypothetical protein